MWKAIHYPVSCRAYPFACRSPKQLRKLMSEGSIGTFQDLRIEPWKFRHPRTWRRGEVLPTKFVDNNLESRFGHGNLRLRRPALCIRARAIIRSRSTVLTPSTFKVTGPLESLDITLKSMITRPHQGRRYQS